uniref:hypothetical protein n=1 Tax=Legionella yabuuchiae TaxID=376727 RepID=UPI0013EF7F01
QRLSDLLEQQTRAAQEATQKTSELETRLNTTQRENQALQERTRALEGENAALLAEIDELKNILATASEDIRVKSRQSDLLSEKIYQILLANLKARISKSERLLEKIQHDGVEITQDRIDKHQSEVDLISKQWTNRQPTPEQQEAFDRLILRWNEIRTELESVLQQKTETVSPPPSPMQSIISESTSRIQSNSPELEEEQQYVTSPQISSSDSTPPSSPRENQNISTSEHALPHQDSESPASTHKIFALLNRNGNALQSRSNKDLFEEIEGEQVIRINFPDATILTEKEAREFLGTGTEVKSPANHTYTLGMKDGKPWASLAKKEVAIKEDESEEQSRQRLAVTVMNMVENILSKGTVINIKTNDPFIAKVADQYINHLKQIGISISKYTLSGVELDENHKSFKDENHKSFKEAKQIFDRLKPKYSRDVLESNAPWYKEAQTYREKLQTRNTQEETQSTSNSPIRR